MNEQQCNYYYLNNYFLFLVGDIKDPPDVGCRSNPVVVPVQPRDIISVFKPAFVVLHRCAGGCVIHNSIFGCTATHRTTVNVRVHYPQDQSSCIVPMVNETQCMCQCVKSAKDCSPRQVWNEKQCSCACNEELVKLCRQKGNPYRWDEDSCSCNVGKPFYNLKK